MAQTEQGGIRWVVGSECANTADKRGSILSRVKDGAIVLFKMQHDGECGHDRRIPEVGVKFKRVPGDV